ncbi:MAG: hypothetical protein OEW44_08125 [Gemmatimonadota bacterium]|nr:hypothetical protein [Gemmatimonadota bacterium]
MSSRRVAVSFVALLLLAGCGEAVAPSAAPDPLPHFVRWAPAAPAQFAAVVRRSGHAPRLMAAAVAVPTADSGTTSAATTSQLTWLHPVGVTANRLLVVGVSTKDTTTVTGVTYGGAPLTFSGASSDESSGARVELWYLIGPASGRSPVSVSLSGPADVIGGAMTFSGVDQATPLGGFVGNGSTGSGATDPSVVVTNAAGELVFAALTIAGNPGVLTPAQGLTQTWIGYKGLGHSGAGAVAPGSDTVTLGWTKTSPAKWAIGAVAIKAATWSGPPLDQFQVSFSAVRGQPSTVEINYLGAAGGVPQPFLRLEVTDPTFVPGRGNLAPGDSVQLTVTVDPVNILVQLEPSGVQFGQPAGLNIWYGGAGSDLNGDGVVDGTDADIESGHLKVWYQEGAADPWAAISAVQSSTDRTFTALLPHFSNYAVAY